MMVHVYRNRPDDYRTRDGLRFCDACGGWYGVSHEHSHCQQGEARWPWGDCACRPCREASGKPIEGRFGFFTEVAEWQP